MGKRLRRQGRWAWAAWAERLTGGGVPMGFQWGSHGFPLGCGFLWVSYRIPMGFLWGSCRIPQGILWNSYRDSDGGRTGGRMVGLEANPSKMHLLVLTRKSLSPSFKKLML